MTASWQFIKSVFARNVILSTVLVAAFLAFAFHPGSLGDIMRLCYAIYFVYFFVGTYHFRSLTRAHLAMFAVILIILLLSFTVPKEQVHSSARLYFIAMPGLVLICHLVAVHFDSNSLRRLKILCLGVITIAVLGQLIAYFFPFGNDYGVYDNMHHLGLFASVCIPLAGYFAFVSGKWCRILAAMIGLVALYLLIESGSRISWLALFISVLITAVVLPNKKHVIYFVFLGLLAVIITAGISGIDNIGIRIEDFLTNWRTEERLYIWRDIVELIKQNTVLDWLRGKGIGSFRYFFKDYAGLSIEKLEAQPTFPHNIFFQVLFENGIAGLILIFWALGAFVRKLWLGIRRPAPDSTRYLYIVCFITFWILFIHTVLTKSIYSRYIAYLFSMAAGTALALDQRGEQAKTLVQLFPSLTPKTDQL